MSYWDSGHSSLSHGWIRRMSLEAAAQRPSWPGSQTPNTEEQSVLLDSGLENVPLLPRCDVSGTSSAERGFRVCTTPSRRNTSKCRARSWHRTKQGCLNTCLQRPSDPVHREKKPSILGFQCYVPSQATLLPQFHQKPTNYNPPTPVSTANFRSLKGQGPYLPWHLGTEPFKVQGRASASPGSSLWL